MKMYICIKNSVAPGMAMNSAAHAGLMCHMKFCDDGDYQDWLDRSFKKVTCSVTEAEFAMLKTVDHHLIVTESRLNNAEVAIVLKPRNDNEWPEFVSLLQLWK